MFLSQYKFSRLPSVICRGQHSEIINFLDYKIDITFPVLIVILIPTNLKHKKNLILIEIQSLYKCKI